MTEKTAEQISLARKIGKVQMDLVWKGVLKGRKVNDSAKLTDEDGVQYDEVVHRVGDIEYVIHPKHVTLDMVSDYGNSSCRGCWGKGYNTVEVAKRSLHNPSDYIILSRRPLENLSDEEREKAIEDERKNPRWRILLACNCAIQRMSKSEPNFYVTDDRSIMLRLDYEERSCVESSEVSE